MNNDFAILTLGVIAVVSVLAVIVLAIFGPPQSSNDALITVASSAVAAIAGLVTGRASR